MPRTPPDEPGGHGTCCGHRGAGLAAPPSDGEEEFELLFGATSDGVLLLEPDGTIARANAAAGELLGRAPCCLCGRDEGVRALLAPCDHRANALVRQWRRDGTAAGAVTALRADGSPVDLQVRVVTCRGKSGEAHPMILFRSAEPVDPAARAAPQPLPLSDAHDLRAPLGTLAGFAKALERALGDDAPLRSRHYVERILAAVAQLESHVEAALSVARIAHAPLAMRRVDLSAAARRILHDLRLRDLDRIVSVQVQDGICARGDPRLLETVLENLLGNAWKFTRRRAEGSIWFTAEHAPDGSVVYRVRDNGAGFDMAHAGKLFREFQRLHSQSEFPGTGVGLANVRRIVQRHGGRVSAESAPGEGASFSFTVAGCAASHCCRCAQDPRRPVRDAVPA